MPISKILLLVGPLLFGLGLEWWQSAFEVIQALSPLNQIGWFIGLLSALGLPTLFGVILDYSRTAQAERLNTALGNEIKARRMEVKRRTAELEELSLSTQRRSFRSWCASPAELLALSETELVAVREQECVAFAEISAEVVSLFALEQVDISDNETRAAYMFAGRVVPDQKRDDAILERLVAIRGMYEPPIVVSESMPDSIPHIVHSLYERAKEFRFASSRHEWEPLLAQATALTKRYNLRQTEVGANALFWHGRFWVLHCISNQRIKLPYYVAQGLLDAARTVGQKAEDPTLWANYACTAAVALFFAGDLLKALAMHEKIIDALEESVGEEAYSCNQQGSHGLQYACSTRSETIAYALQYSHEEYSTGQMGVAFTTLRILYQSSLRRDFRSFSYLVGELISDWETALGFAEVLVRMPKPLDGADLAPVRARLSEQLAHFENCELPDGVLLFGRLVLTRIDALAESVVASNLLPSLPTMPRPRFNTNGVEHPWKLSLEGVR